MKKHSKRKGAPVLPPEELDLAGQISKIQQQLVFLEKKIDTLISQSQERPFKEKHFPQHGQRFDRPRQHGHGRGRGDRDNSYRDRERGFTAICADCNRECEIPFRPSGDRPVYCKECFARRRSDDR